MAFPFAAVGLGLGAISEGFKLFGGNKQRKEAENAINNFEFQELQNPAKNISVSTVGSDIIKEEGQRFTANALEAAQGGGIRGVLSAVPRLAAINTDIARDAGALVDDQIRNREFAIAEVEENNQRIREERDFQRLAGLGRKLAVGQQNFFSGLSGLSNLAFAGSSFLNSGGSGISGEEFGRMANLSVI